MKIETLNIVISQWHDGTFQANILNVNRESDNFDLFIGNIDKYLTIWRIFKQYVYKWIRLRDNAKIIPKTTATWKHKTYF